MTLHPQAMLAHLVAKEKVKGHHSPEGRAIRTLSRALSGWLARALSSRDVVVLCDQAVEDWLKARIKIPAWSEIRFGNPVDRARSEELISEEEVLPILLLRTIRRRFSGAVNRKTTTAMLQVCVELIYARWEGKDLQDGGVV